MPGGAIPELQQLVAGLWENLGHTYCRFSRCSGERDRWEVQAAYTPTKEVNGFEQRLCDSWRLSGITPGCKIFGVGSPEVDDLSRQLGSPFSSRLLLGVHQGDEVLGVLDVGERRKPMEALERQTAEGYAHALSHIFDLLARGLDTEQLALAARCALQHCGALRKNQLLERLEELVARWSVPTPLNELHQDIAQQGALLFGFEEAILLRQLGDPELTVEGSFGVAGPHLGDKVLVPEAWHQLLASGAKPAVLNGHDLPLALREGRQQRRALALPILPGEGASYILVLKGTLGSHLDVTLSSVAVRFCRNAANALQQCQLVAAAPLRRAQRDMLQKLGDFLQTTNDEEEILQASLTGITAGYGLGLNRAALFLEDEGGASLVGQVAIGQLTLEEAQSVWRAVPPMGASNFDEYLQALSEGTLSPAATSLQERIQGCAVSAEPVGDDPISDALRSKRSMKASEAKLPDQIQAAFEPHREIVVAPLVAGDRTLGVLICDNKFTQRPLVEGDIHGLEQLARTLSMALQNRTKMRALFEASNTLNSWEDQHKSWEELVDLTRKAAQADVAKLFLAKAHPEGFEFRLEEDARNKAGRRSAEDSEPEARNNGISAEAMRTGKPIPIQNVATDPRVNPRLRDSGLGAALCMPWSVRGTPIGVMWFHFVKGRRFSKRDIDDLQLYLNNIAAAWDALQQRRHLEKVQRVLAEVSLATTKAGGGIISSIVRGTQEVLGCDTVTLYRSEPPDVLRCEAEMPGVRYRARATKLKRADSHSLVHELFQLDAPYLARDTSVDPHFMHSRFTRDEAIKSVATVPLVADGERVGILFLSYREHQAFAEAHLQQMTLFANHAAIAIHTATQFKQRKSLLDLARDLRASHTRKEIQAHGVEYAHRLLGADLACIALLNPEDEIVVEAAKGWDLTHVGKYVLPPGNGSHAGYTIAQKEPVFVFDFENETRFGVPDIRKQHGSVSGIGVPMQSDGDVIVGALLVHTKQRRSFTNQEAELLRLIASLTAVAMKNAERSSTVDKHRGRLGALRMALGAIDDSRTANRQQILKRILENTVDNLVTERDETVLGTIQLYRPRENKLIFEVFHPERLYDEALAAAGREISLDKLPSPRGVTTEAFDSGEAQLINDVSNCSFYVAVNPQIRSELAVPIMDGGRKLGVINVESDRANAFDHEDQATLLATARLAALVVRNAEQQSHHVHVTHTAKSPVARVIQNAGILKNHATGNGVPLSHAELLETVEKILRASRNLKRIVRNMLEIATIGQSSVSLGLKRENVAEMIRELVDDLLPDATHKRLELRVDGPPQLDADIDRNRLSLALENLLTNAIKFTDSGSVQVKYRAANNKLVIEIEDTGQGILNSLHEKIFECFFRVNESNQVEGSGIGLAIVKMNVELHGGQIQVHSAPGQGAKFKVTLVQYR